MLNTKKDNAPYRIPCPSSSSIIPQRAIDVWGLLWLCAMPDDGKRKTGEYRLISKKKNKDAGAVLCRTAPFEFSEDVWPLARAFEFFGRPSGTAAARPPPSPSFGCPRPPSPSFGCRRCNARGRTAGDVATAVAPGGRAAAVSCFIFMF